jgi:hypothetical protein
VAGGSTVGGTAGTKSLLAGLIYSSVPPSLAGGQQVALQGDAQGNLKVNVVTGSLGNNASVGYTGTTAPTSATEIGGIDPSGNLVAPGVADASTAALATQPALVVALSPNSNGVSIDPQLLNAQEDPSTGNQTNNLTSTVGLASPVTAVGSSCAYMTLGGEFYLNSTPASENLLGVFAYQVPAGHTLYVTNVFLPSPVVTSEMGGGFGQIWELFIANAAIPSAAVGTRFPLTTFGAQNGAQVGSNLSGGSTMPQSFQTPIVVPGGTWVLICYKVVGAGSATGTFRGTCYINGFFD